MEFTLPDDPAELLRVEAQLRVEFAAARLMYDRLRTLLPPGVKPQTTRAWFAVLCANRRWELAQEKYKRLVRKDLPKGAVGTTYGARRK